ncbi:MAG: reverse transcriptase domain-containing protein, partial [Bacteroidota bacterium]
TMSADISNAFCTAKNMEPKVWVDCGPEFRDRQGQKATLRRALYGMSSSRQSFHDYCGDILWEMDFRPSRADPDLWIRISDDYNGYDYIATWVDDIICVGKNPQKYMEAIAQQFDMRNVMLNRQIPRVRY